MQISLGELHRTLSITFSDVTFRSLEEIGRRSHVLLEKKKSSGLLDKGKDSQEVVNLVEELRIAIAFYQVSRGHLVQTSINDDETVITTTVDIQSDRKIDCKASRRS